MSGFVYFVQCHDRVKIGFSTNPTLRLVKIEADTPYDCALLGVVDAAVFPERELHEQFAMYRMKGEWFLAARPILDFIAEHSAPAEPEPMPVELSAPPAEIIGAEHVKALRASFGETQIQFAKRVGVTPLTISGWERLGPPMQGAARRLLTNMIERAAA